MSEFQKVQKLSDRAGTGAVNFTNGFNINGSDSGLSGFAHTEGATEPSSPSNGDTWWDSDNSIYKVYMNGEWKEWLGESAGSSTPYLGTRGFMLGGNGSTTNMSYIDITTAGNAQDFGDMIGMFSLFSGVGNGARIVTMGGYNNSLSGTKQTNQIQYFASATTGDASDFGDLTQARDKTATVGDATRAVCGGGTSGGSHQNTMDYITIASTGNAADFGDLVLSRSYHGSTNDGTRGVFTVSYTHLTLPTKA